MSQVRFIATKKARVSTYMCIEDNTGQVVPPLGKPNLDVAGPAAFDWLECCITRCRDSCTNCEYDVTNSIYPRRVVQILQHPRSRDDLALVTDFGSAHGEYLTLSYCWGEPHQPQASTTKNLPRRAKGFRSDVLPATLRDAIAVTRRLGFQYLWIDSLCILQDSAKDKKVETRKMKSIFQSSSLTLVAASTGSVSTGFLTERLPAPSIKLGKVPFWTTPNQLSSIELDLVDGDAFRRPDPVHLRAWTLEEWMLPRRRVVFTRGQLFWTCYGFSEVDGGFAAPGIPYSLGNMDVVRVEEENAVINQNPQGDNTEDEADLHEVGSIEGTRGLQLWYDIVGEYTSRDLTDSGDKSAAIDGLAQKIAQRHGFEYAWGLWTEDLARGLCWHHRSYDIDRPDPATLSRSALNPCPSWSWMSINCRCEFIEDYDDLTPLASVRIIPGLEPQELHVEGAALSALNITMPSNLGEAPYILAVETLFDLPKDVQVNLWNPGTHSNMNLWSDTQEVFTVAPEKFRFLFLFEFTAGTWEATLPDAENDYDEYDRAYMNQAAITAGGLLVVPETDGSNRVRRLGYFVMAPAAYTIELLVSKQRSQWILC